MTIFILNVVLLLICHQLELSTSCRFDDPDSWVKEYLSCGGDNQSPIKIDLQDVTYRTYDSNLTIHNQESMPDGYTLYNDGTALKLFGIYADGLKSYLVGGPFSIDEYEFDHLRFVWSALNDKESGHQIGDTNYPMETQWVLYKKEYESIDNARNHPDGLIIVAGLWAVKEHINKTALSTKIIPQLIKVSQPGSETLIEPFAFGDLEAEPASEINAYLYSGSETIPPCAPATWVVLKYTYYLTSAELEAFRVMTLANGENYNMRPVQPLNGREVWEIIKIAG